MTIHLDFYGVTVLLEAPAELSMAIMKDFSFFADANTTAAPLIRIVARNEKPPLERIPAVTASLYQPDSLSYDHDGFRYVDYHGTALAVCDHHRGAYELYSEDAVLLHELTYLLIHSRAGALLDARGMHRVHGLGLSLHGRNVLCLLPQGGGKSTLALSVLAEPEVRLFSDDIPLIDRHGRIFPMPVRMGICAGAPHTIPEQYLTTFHRRKHGDKLLIDMSYFAGKIAEPAALSAIVIGVRVGSGPSHMMRVSKFAALSALMRDCVIGLGLPQVVEFFLRYRWGDIWLQGRTVFSRLRALIAVCTKAETFRFEIGPDRAEAGRTLHNFFRSR